MGFNRRASTQDVTWFIDLYDSGRLVLDPPYQRRSVWGPKDRKFFLDTVFRGYPSPAIYLHKVSDDYGKSSYEVIDGKQRLETIILFRDNRLSLGRDFNDERLDGKRWKQVINDPELREKFWNYEFAVDYISTDDLHVSLNEIFDRLNRNSRKLNEQELRHARYEGWFISFVEDQADSKIWRDWGISTTGREKRMLDAQFISELMMVLIDGEIHGFSQNLINDFYTKYDFPDEDEDLYFDVDETSQRFSQVVLVFKEIDKIASLKTYAKDAKSFYTLWAYVVRNVSIEKVDLEEPNFNKLRIAVLAERYKQFMDIVYECLESIKRGESTDRFKGAVVQYAVNLGGASTELPQRQARLKALAEYMEEQKDDHDI